MKTDRTMDMASFKRAVVVSSAVSRSVNHLEGIQITTVSMHLRTPLKETKRDKGCSIRVHSSHMWMGEGVACVMIFSRFRRFRAAVPPPRTIGMHFYDLHYCCPHCRPLTAEVHSLDPMEEERRREKSNLQHRNDITGSQRIMQ